VTTQQRQDLADRIEAARTQLEEAMVAAEEQARADYAAEGVSEVQMAADFRVNRLTVRRWLGK